MNWLQKLLAKCGRQYVMYRTSRYSYEVRRAKQRFGIYFTRESRTEGWKPLSKHSMAQTPQELVYDNRHSSKSWAPLTKLVGAVVNMAPDEAIDEAKSDAADAMSMLAAGYRPYGKYMLPQLRSQHTSRLMAQGPFAAPPPPPTTPPHRLAPITPPKPDLPQVHACVYCNQLFDEEAELVLHTCPQQLKNK